MFVIKNMDSKPEPSLCAFSQLKFKWIPSIFGNLKEKSSRTTSEFSVIDKIIIVNRTTLTRSNWLCG